MERKLLYGEFFFVQIQTVKNAITCLRLCCSLRDILVACREIGSLPEQVKQKANLRARLHGEFQPGLKFQPG